ncbi:hypothetical protein [Selenomonas ruminis]|uniref:Uncharacterized protein n=1 Tax=Selenomonas ruminis TaxID=2593411 RepID=A0A5D6W874_9FIRM|nr:hypothetical protein [Selenomonas sp. mPRGC5]TYZ22924.1 hypothetical protein FZ040_06815 [Selenomonas sp. mPRGC5]
MEGKIIIKNISDMIHFYWTSLKFGTMYLFSQKFSKGVFDFFCWGRAITEVLSFKNWNRNPKLDKTITKFPIYMKYALKEYIDANAKIA